MKVLVYKDTAKLYSDITKYLIAVVRDLPSFNLGLATGSSPEKLYEHLIYAHRKNEFDAKKITTFNLDEYTSIDENHPSSYHYYMNEKLFNHIKFKNNYLPNGNGNLDLNCIRYNELLESNKIDLQILGIGSNGHIAFNEPGTSFDSVTHIVSLTDQTINDNSRFFDSLKDVPKNAITMGLKNIMEAKEIVLIATGINKAKAIYDMINGPITETIPASILQKHCKVTIYLDKEAASLL